MILLDCGNSKLKAQAWQAGQLRNSYAGNYRVGWEQRLGLWLQGIPTGRCFLASVLDSARQHQLEELLDRQPGMEITRFVSEARTFDVMNAYPQPGKLGDDRWMALLAAREIDNGNCVVIDAGSAITLDLLQDNGQHLGGAILPGFNTSIEQFKSIFSYIDFESPEIAQTGQPGCSTEAAIHIDYERGTNEILPELVNRWIQLFNNEATLLLAGGDAERVQRVLDQPCRIVPDLVFRGIHRLALQ